MVPSGEQTRVPLRALAVVTSVLCVVAQVISRIGSGAEIAHDGPFGVVIGQTIWNAAQVGVLLLLLCLWRIDRRWGIAALPTLACLPVAIYALSPGGMVQGGLILGICAMAVARPLPELRVDIVDAPARGTPTLTKLEFFTFACTLLCSMYNYSGSRAYWPHWAGLYESAARLLGFTAEPAEIAERLYTLGFGGVDLPAYIATGTPGDGAAAVVFLLIWTVLPFLYVLYFAACFRLARGVYGTRVQQALCLFCIFHFLFLTDIVDYQFGRGIVNPAAEWCHWAERLAWRLAILLPIYQKLATGHWLRGNGAVGVVLHYALAAWAVIFVVDQVLVFDAPRFIAFATGSEMTPGTPFGIKYRPELGYHGTLVLMAFVYGSMTVVMRCKRVTVHISALVEAGGTARSARSHPRSSASV